MLPLILLNVAAHLYQYLMVCVSVVILCLRDPEAERPFRLPLGAAIPAVAAVLCVLLLTQQHAVNLPAAPRAARAGARGAARRRSPHRPAVHLPGALGALVVGLVLYAVGRSRSSTSQS